MKQRKNLKAVLIIIGMMLIFSDIRSIYISYKIDKTHETKDYKTIETVRTEEKETYKGISIETIVILLVGLICIASPFYIKDHKCYKQRKNK